MAVEREMMGYHMVVTFADDQSPAQIAAVLNSEALLPNIPIDIVGNRAFMAFLNADTANLNSLRAEVLKMSPVADVTVLNTDATLANNPMAI